MGNTPGALGDGGQDLTPTTQTAAVPFDELTSLLKVRDDGDGAAATSRTAEPDATDSDAVTLPARITDRRHHHHTLEYKRKHAVWDTGVLLVPEVFPTIEDALLNIESPLLSDSSYHKATHRRRHRQQP